MATMRRQVTCGECRTLFEPRGRAPRCPSCGEPWEEHEPLPPLPRVFVPDHRLQDPDYPQNGPIEPPPAPASEFFAAGGILAGFVTMVVGVALVIPIVLIAGMAILGTAAIVYGVVRTRRLIRRGRDWIADEHENPWRRFNGPFR